jgi:hypothetical protein
LWQLKQSEEPAQFNNRTAFRLIVVVGLAFLVAKYTFWSLVMKSFRKRKRWLWIWTRFCMCK